MQFYGCLLYIQGTKSQMSNIIKDVNSFLVIEGNNLEYLFSYRKVSPVQEYLIHKIDLFSSSR